LAEQMSAAAISTSGGAAVEVRLENLRREYGPVVALDGLDLTLAPGELVALLGPSGCGKTSALRLVAGLEEADAGRVVVGGKDVTSTSANKRGMGMVFQAYSLFPHMTARQNVAFGLRLRGVKDAERKRRAGEMLELVGLAAQSDRYAHQMSGGQQQRVALARALAIQPQVLLLDEPLSALDAKVRGQLRDEIRRVQLEVGTTTLFVTHDQEEALAIADRVGVMRAGRLEQLASPTDVYSRPESAFVAEFVGLTNRIPAVVSGGRVQVLGVSVPVVGEAIVLGTATGAPADAAGVDASVLAASFLGPISRLTVTLPDGRIVMAQLPTSLATEFPAGGPVRVSVRPDPVPVAPADLAAVPGESPV